MKNFNLFIEIFATLLLVYAFPCSGLVSGTVTDAFENPVSGASVVFTSEVDSSQTWSATTDVNGKYQIAVTTSVNQENNASHLPQTFLLRQNYPNPFNPTTIIPFTLSKPNNCMLSIFNIQGQKVCTLIDGYFSMGAHSVIWNGLDDRNRPASAGIYFYQLRVGGKSETKKMLLLDGGVSDNYRSVSVISKLEKNGKIVAITYRVTITGSEIIQYIQNGLIISNAGTYDFTVIRINEYQGITFVSIPGGTFQMGQTGVAEPVHSVTVSAFQMSEAEITNAQYCAYLNAAIDVGDIMVTNSVVTGTKGVYNLQECIYLAGTHSIYPEARCWIIYSNNKFSVISGHENWPVVWVTWYGAKVFAEYYGWDLPREAEWEYACRGGKQYEYGTDNGTLSISKANYFDNGINHPIVVGNYPKNPFGLYDMCGNVWEWCNDWYGDYSSSPANNPTGAQSGSAHVIRGGCWYNSEILYFRSASRDLLYPNNGSLNVGFRVVRRETQSQIPQEINLVPIPGGTFQMGDEIGGSGSDCRPVHTVTVSSFQVSEAEITNEQYCAYLNAAFQTGDITATELSVTGKKGAYSWQEYLYPSGTNQCWITFNNNEFSVISGHENWPLVSVTWYGSKAFAYYYGWDLPREAEWEYACRGGKQYLYGTDDGTINKDKTNYWGKVGHPVNVKSYPKNPFGLYDMSGNVLEWCSDWYGSYNSSPAINPTGALTGSFRVVRGGGWGLFDGNCVSFERGGDGPGYAGNGVGFRVVRR